MRAGRGGAPKGWGLSSRPPLRLRGSEAVGMGGRLASQVPAAAAPPDATH
ncbi:hypothetical protein NDU88_005773, partial [Pleurodeles waltl]